MPMGKFLLYTTLGAGIWNSVLALLGWFIFKTFPVQILPYLYYPMAIGVAALASILFRYPKRYS